MQAALVHAINPQIQVDAIEERVENVPLASMDSSILVSCVDNRLARQTINRIAWRCCDPWIDAAVDAASLIRINAYVPGESAPCLECAWDERSYDLLEQEYPCAAGSAAVPATGAPAELGALAASLQAGELRRLLDNAVDETSLVGGQLMFDTLTHSRHLCRFKRNDQCRFDHEMWKVETADVSPTDDTLADLFDAVARGSDPAIGLEGHSFAMHINCVACDDRSDIGLALFGRLSEGDRTCSCRGRMFASGFFSLETIRQSELSTSFLDLNLSTVGFRAGDVISVSGDAGSTRHVEIGNRVVQ